MGKKEPSPDSGGSNIEELIAQAKTPDELIEAVSKVQDVEEGADPAARREQVLSGSKLADMLRNYFYAHKVKWEEFKPPHVFAKESFKEKDFPQKWDENERAWADYLSTQLKRRVQPSDIPDLYGLHQKILNLGSREKAPDDSFDAELSAIMKEISRLKELMPQHINLETMGSDLDLDILDAEKWKVPQLKYAELLASRISELECLMSVLIIKFVHEYGNTYIGSSNEFIKLAEGSDVGEAITLPNLTGIREALKRKIYFLTEKSQGLPYGHLENEMTIFQIVCVKIIEKLLKDGTMKTKDFAKELSRETGEVPTETFFAACNLVKDWLETGGESRFSEYRL